MSDRWAGITVSGAEVLVVVLDVPESGPCEIVADDTFPLQNGDRPAAYHIMHERVTSYLKENGIANVAIKGSAVNRAGTKLAHLEAAELRGVVAAAAAAAAVENVVTPTKAALSKGFGTRKVDEYLKDSEFWDGKVDGDLRRGSREAALLIVAASGHR